MTRSWRRPAVILAALLGGGGLFGGVGGVAAQPAAAIGQPLPDDKAEARTVAVRVMAGDISKPVVGTDVTLDIIPADGGAKLQRIARTDPAGRAMFVDLPPGAVVTASVIGPGGPQSSTSFPVPATGGIRVLLSTLPVAGAAVGAPPGGPASGPAAGGPPEPRKMSGRPRPQPGDAPDTLTVRLTYDDLADARPPQDQPVMLVGYRYDQTVSAKLGKTDPAGRAVFDGLDRTGATAYFAMTLLPRGEVHDRLTSGPIQMIADDGMRLMLAGEKRDSGKPAVDDYATLAPQPSAPMAPGTIEVVIAGVPERGAAVELVDAMTGAVVATQPSGDPLPAGGTTTATWKPATDEPSLIAGTVEVTVTIDGQPGIPLVVEARRRAPPPAPARPGAPPVPPPAPPPPVTATTDASGRAVLTGLAPGEEVDLVVVTPAGASSATPVKMSATGGARIAVDVSWQERGQAGARLVATAAGPATAYFVRSTMRGQVHLSAPFQVAAERGVSVNLLAMPRVMLNFSLTSWVDDQFLVVSGQWTIGNSSWAPYLASKNGRPTELVIPMPRRATGLQVRDDFASVVGNDPTRGLILRRPLPPGGLEFFAGFSMKIVDGEVGWDMDLPLGSFESGIELLRSNNATRIELPPEVTSRVGGRMVVEEATDRRGKFWVLSPITILPDQRMVFRVTGLPTAPAWHYWAEVGVGVSVLLVLGLGLWFALHRGAATAARDATAARYERLLDELADLERSGATSARKGELMTELEALRERLDQARRGAATPPGTGPGA